MDFYFIYLHCADTSSLLPVSLLSSVRQCFHHTADGFAWGVWQGSVSVLPLSRQDVLASSFLPPCPISCLFSQRRKHCIIWTWSVNKIVILGPWRLGKGFWGRWSPQHIHLFQAKPNFAGCCNTPWAPKTAPGFTIGVCIICKLL